MELRPPPCLKRGRNHKRQASDATSDPSAEGIAVAQALASGSRKKSGEARVTSGSQDKDGGQATVASSGQSTASSPSGGQATAKDSLQGNPDHVPTSTTCLTSDPPADARSDLQKKCKLANALQHKLNIELCARSAGYSAKLFKMGLGTLPIDSSTNRHRQQFPCIILDLTMESSHALLEKLLAGKRIFSVGAAPPCGTASRAREKRTKKRYRSKRIDGKIYLGGKIAYVKKKKLVRTNGN